MVIKRFDQVLLIQDGRRARHARNGGVLCVKQSYETGRRTQDPDVRSSRRSYQLSHTGYPVKLVLLFIITSKLILE